MTSKITIPLEPLKNLAQAATKLSTRFSRINFRTVKGEFRIYSVSPEAMLLWSTPTELTAVSVAVEASKFFALLKKLYEDFTLTFNEKSVTLTQQNVKANFPVSICSDLSSKLTEFLPLSAQEASWMTEAMPLCGLLAVTNITAGDFTSQILVDSRSGYFQAVRMTPSAVFFSGMREPATLTTRFVLPEKAADLFHGFRDKIEKLEVNERYLKMQLLDGLKIFLPVLEDYFPQGAANVFEADAETAAQNGGYHRYEFDTNNLISVLDLVLTALHGDTEFLQFSLIGSDRETGVPVWTVTGDSSVRISESLPCTCSGTIQDVMFSIRGRDLLNFSKLFGERLVMYVCSKSNMLLVSDVEGRNRALLIKVLA